MSDYIRNRLGKTQEEGDSFFCRFTFGQFFALLVLEVFTLFFIFYLGAKYGREFLGLEKMRIAEEVKVEEGAVDGNQVLSTADPEAAKLAKEIMAKSDAAPELKERITKMFQEAQGGAEAEQKKPPVVEINQAAELPKEAAPQEIVAKEQPQAMLPPKETAEAEALPAAPKRELPSVSDNEADMSDKSVVRVKSVENARYSVQVGSYPQMNEASRSVEKWKVKGYPAYVMIADIPDRGRWYRVRIGGFPSQSEAGKYLKEFQAKENIEGLIVMNEQ